ncbi:hypothetical protein L249_0494 [Ophiocordyceps polyrhachis-furcata BCC 54312]|uniref:EVE domain-containing protein n=1 Tax=Ophiocordyceps polyrhachis-furcata BCC 54312 TaxID=1330021 RepID=A0A367LCZ5_9HYPO|nr:hypothetical protein L249_0494 [Ophiocordyceps polyrhachis-furcata BCC 54312]
MMPRKRKTADKSQESAPKRRRSSRQASKEEQKDYEDVPAAAEPNSAVNPEAPRHDGEWYWLMKAEPEPRFENGVDVSFSIDDLRAKTEPEGWDGIRAYAGASFGNINSSVTRKGNDVSARNNLRKMNVHDKSFFYHSNCKEPGIVGIMEIVKEFSPDETALIPGAPYYDPASTKENPRWSLVHVEFRRKLAVPIPLRELRELGHPGGVLENMQMLKQSRLSVSRVSESEWAALCRLADEKASEAGLEHVDA